jgi:hypothetical protein
VYAELVEKANPQPPENKLEEIKQRACAGSRRESAKHKIRCNNRGSPKGSCFEAPLVFLGIFAFVPGLGGIGDSRT